MITIKFRGKRLDNGEWIYGDLLENQGRNFIYHATSESTIEDNDDGRIVVVAVEVDYNTIGQYTGLNDNNGREIYEGDVLRMYDNKRYTFTCMQSAFLGRCNETRLGLANITERVSKEIIGNSHDNPELLKGGEQ